MAENKRKLFWLILLLVVLVSFAVKFEALNKNESAPSPDYGNYLTQVNIINGIDVEGSGLRYNPLYFAILDGFLSLTDPFTALKILASLTFSIAAIPFFLLAKRLSNSLIFSIVCSWLFIFFEGYSEMISWGGNPNFLGISFMLLALFFLVGYFKDASKKNLILTGFFLSLVVGTHFLVAFYTLGAFLLFLFAFCFSINTIVARSRKA